jgi:hypothetical protein
MKVAALTRADIEAFMRSVAEGKTAARSKTGKKRGLSNVRGGRGTASRTVGLLGAIFTYAIRHGMRSDNPVHGVMRPADGRRERRLSNEEYAAFGVGLRLADTKTGLSIRPLSTRPATCCVTYRIAATWYSPRRGVMAS